MNYGQKMYGLSKWIYSTKYIGDDEALANLAKNSQMQIKVGLQ